MIRVMMFVMAGIVSFMMVGSVEAKQTPANWLEAKAEVGARPELPSRHQMTGTVKAIDLVDKTFRVKNRRGEKEFLITSETQFKKGRTQLKLAELKPGTRVLVKYWELDGERKAGIIKLKKVEKGR